MTELAREEKPDWGKVVGFCQLEALLGKVVDKYVRPFPKVFDRAKELVRQAGRNPLTCLRHGFSSLKLRWFPFVSMTPPHFYLVFSTPVFSHCPLSLCLCLQSPCICSCVLILLCSPVSSYVSQSFVLDVVIFCCTLCFSLYLSMGPLTLFFLFLLDFEDLFSFTFSNKYTFVTHHP